MPAIPAICLYGDKPIKSGRSDKKFCDSGCKDTYYNSLKSGEHNEIKEIDSIQKRNRRMLKKVYNERKPEKLISREVLVKAGFEFGLYPFGCEKHKAMNLFFVMIMDARNQEKDNFKMLKSSKN